MSQPATASASGRIRWWPNLVTVVSAAILVGTETVGASLAFSWALAGWFGLGDVGTSVLEACGFVLGLSAVVWFFRFASRCEPWRD